MSSRNGPPDSSGGGARHRPRPTAENAPATTLHVLPQDATRRGERAARLALTRLAEHAVARGDVSARSPLYAALQRRRDAARRLPALPDRDGADVVAHDPLLPWPRAERSPSTFGLSARELVAEAGRLRRAGWSPEEIAAVLAVPEAVPS